MNYTYERPSTGCPEIDLLLQNVDILREKLLEFRDILGNKYIDHPKETECQKAVLRQIDRYEQARQIAERAASYRYDYETAAKIREALEDARETTAEDVLDYHRAMLTYDRRADEYNRASVLARQFLSPRTRFNEAWEAEARIGRSAFPEVNMFFIVVVVFGVLATCSMFYSEAVEARCKAHPTVFQIEASSDLKTFTLPDFVCTFRQTLLAFYYSAKDFWYGTTGGIDYSNWMDYAPGATMCAVKNLSSLIKATKAISIAPLIPAIDVSNMTAHKV